MKQILQSPNLADLKFKPLGEALAHADEEAGPSSAEFPLAAFASRALAPKEALNCWKRVRQRVQGSKVVVVVSEEGLVSDERRRPLPLKILSGARALSTVPLPTLDDVVRPKEAKSLRASLSQRFGEDQVLATLQHYGVVIPTFSKQLKDSDFDGPFEELLIASEPAPSPEEMAKRIRAIEGSKSESVLYLPSRRVQHRNEHIEEIHWAFPLLRDEGPMRIVVLETSESVLAPLFLRWMFTPERALQYSALFGSWRDRFGFEIVYLGRDTLEGYVPRRPRTLADVQRLSEEHLTLTQDFGQADDLTAAVLFNVLGHHWSFWWD